MTFYAVSATMDTVPGMDNGADPNEIVTINDNLAATTLPGSELFSVLETPSLGTVYRGVALAPVPEPGSLALLATGALGLLLRRRRVI